MCVWDGCPIQPESEREQQHAWETEGDLPFIEEEWPEHLAGPEYDAWKKKRDEDRSA